MGVQCGGCESKLPRSECVRLNWQSLHWMPNNVEKSLQDGRLGHRPWRLGKVSDFE